MAQLLKNCVGRNGLLMLSKPFNGLSNAHSLCPVFVGPTVMSERQYRGRVHLKDNKRSSQKQVDTVSRKSFFDNETLFNTVVRHLSTESRVGDLVYTGRIGHLFKILKVFSLTTSSIGLAVQPYLLLTYADMPLVTALPMLGAINMFVFLNPILIHFVAKKYVSELYFNPQSGVFTAVLMTFFARRMHFTFKATDVEVPDVPGPFSMLTAKGKPLFVHESDFSNMNVYKHLMGFDRPLDIVFEDYDEHDKRKKE